MSAQKPSSGDNDELASRTLFVYNVPPYADKSGLRNVFSCYGSVQHVLLYTKPTRNPFSAVAASESDKQPSSSSFFRNILFENRDDEFSIEVDKTADDEFCFKVAYVVFAESESIDRAVNKPIQESKVRVLKDPNNKASSSAKVGMQSKIKFKIFSL